MDGIFSVLIYEHDKKTDASKATGAVRSCVVREFSLCCPAGFILSGVK